MYRIALSIAGGMALACTWAGVAAADETSRLTEAATVIKEIKTDIPQEYWDRAHCVAVIPNLKKGAFIFGGEYGKGAMSCRSGESWSAPVFMQIAKGSWGFQAGAEEVDLTPAPVGTSGSGRDRETVTVDRAQLLQLRRQVEEALASLNRR